MKRNWIKMGLLVRSAPWIYQCFVPSSVTPCTKRPSPINDHTIYQHVFPYISELYNFLFLTEKYTVQYFLKTAA